MAVVQCPECNSDVGAGEISEGSEVTVECPNCFTELLVYYNNEELVVEPLESKTRIESEWEKEEYEEEETETTEEV